MNRMKISMFNKNMQNKLNKDDQQHKDKYEYQKQIPDKQNEKE